MNVRQNAPHQASGHTIPAILFANAKAGRGGRWLFAAIGECEAQGLRVQAVHFALEASRVREALRAAEKSNVGTVLVAGGDGSIASVLQHLIHTDFKLGILPAGTGNDFARSLQIPMDARGAIAVIRAGSTARIDVGVVDGRVFGHAAIIGLNTEFAREAQSLRRYLGWLSYPVASLRVYRRRTCIDIDIDTQAQTRHVSALQVAFVNASIAGGPLELKVQGADVVDSAITVLAVPDLGLSDVLRSLPFVLKTRSLNVRGSKCFTITQATVRSKRELTITIDGEDAGSTPAEILVDPAALQVFVPEGFGANCHV
ncbi:MAG: diacylglycerol/lipid kinase family protein [Chloroflexota bacterium]